MIIALHIALLVQAPEKSGWLPYLRLLPKKFDTMPVRYPPELMEILPQNAVAHVNKQKAKIQADYNCTMEFLQVSASSLFFMNAIVRNWSRKCTNKILRYGLYSQITTS